jgi:exonuclease III
VPAEPVRCRNVLVPNGELRMGIWNVCTVSPDTAPGKLEILAGDLERFGIDVACVTEARIAGKGVKRVMGLEPGSSFQVYHSGHEYQSVNGVAVVVSGKMKGAVVSHEFVDERIMAIRFRQTAGFLTVVVAYAPTEVSNAAKKDDFYDVLNTVIAAVPKHDMVIVAGDLNAETGRCRLGWERTLGKFGAGERNDNGERLLRFAADCRLKVANSYFQHKHGHQMTWYSNAGNARKVLDYLLISGRFASAVSDVRVYRRTALNSDHELVIARLKLRLKAKKCPPPQKKFDLIRLERPETQAQLKTELRNGLTGVALSVDDDDAWSTVKEAMLTAGKAAVGFTKPNRYISRATMAIAEVKRGAVSTAERKLLSKQLRRSLRKDERAHWNSIAEEMEVSLARGNSHQLFRTLKRITGKCNAVSDTITDGNGAVIVDQEKRLPRWTEYFSGLLNRPPPVNVDPDLQQAADEATPSDEISIERPSYEEIRKVVMGLKSGKAPGPDGIPAEFFKIGVEELMPTLVELVGRVWAGKMTPRDFQVSSLVPVYKKGPNTDCGNYRGICLLPIVGKIISLIVLGRIGRLLDEQTSESQAGFRRGRGTADNIFVLRQLLEQRYQYNQETLVAFLDYSAAFDSVDRKSLWLILKACGVPPFYVQLIQNMYEMSVCRVRAYGQLGDSFDVTTGVRQGDVLSPLLFLKAVDWVVRRATTGEDGMIVGEGVSISTTEYADDLAVVAGNVEDLQSHVDRLQERSAFLGLALNARKCKVIATSPPVSEITANGAPMEVVGQFQYLGSYISAKGDPTREVNVRTGRSMAVFKSLRRVLWKRRQISLAVKMRLFDALVMPVLLYGLELVPLTAANTRKLATHELFCLRSILGVGLRDRIRNEDILRRCGRPVDDDGNVLSFDSRMKRLRVRWLGHVVRMPEERLARRCYFAPKATGWKARAGGQRTTWRSIAKTDCWHGFKTLAYDSNFVFARQLVTIANNRDEWREIVKGTK